MPSTPRWDVRPSDDGALVAIVVRDETPVTVRGFLDGLEGDPAFRAAFTEMLAHVPFEAYCWENPPLTAGGLDAPYACTLVDSPVLAMARADPIPFGPVFDGSGCVRFDSLGGDAVLVAPTPKGPADPYVHLGAFVRDGPADQVDQLWVEVVAAVRDRLGPDPLWLSTAGLGVSWLHVRLDSRPKYYRTRRYAAWPPAGR